MEPMASVNFQFARELSHPDILLDCCKKVSRVLLWFRKKACVKAYKHRPMLGTYSCFRIGFPL